MRIDDKNLIEASGLFDESYYIQQCGSDFGSISPLKHFLQYGWKMRLNPGPFFDTAYYLKNYPDVLEKDLCPLVDFLASWQTHLRNPNPMFNTKFYLDQISPHNPLDINPVTHYIGAAEDLSSPHLLFDPIFYMAANEDVRTSNLRPWYHFWLYGKFEGRSPNALFSPQYYANQLESTYRSFSSIEHYLQQDWFCDYWPSESFNPELYRQLYPQITGAPVTPLEHFFMECNRFGVTANEGLKVVFTDRLQSIGMVDPGGEFGTKLSRMLTVMNYRKLACEIKESGKQVVIFLGHDASRSGAPLVLLRLIKHFAESRYACVLLLKEGGPIVGDYQQHAEVSLLHQAWQKWQVEQLVEAMGELIEMKRVKGAIVSTAVNAGLYACSKAAGIHTITLVHDFLSGYTREMVEWLYRDSDQLVFPAQIVKENAVEQIPLGDIVSHVIPQGLLRSDFGQIDKVQARARIRKSLGIPADAFVVLGCGPVELRKGFDYFLQAARRVIAEGLSGRPIHFVWLGGGESQYLSLHYFSLWDIRKCSMEQNVHILPNTADSEPWFVGADVYFLCSRQDPNPCVVHDSMASAVPVIAFEGSGGAAETLSGGGGISVPYADIESASRAILNFYENENARIECGVAGRSAISRFDFREYARQIENLLADSSKIHHLG